MGKKIKERNNENMAVINMVNNLKELFPNYVLLLKKELFINVIMMMLV